ncbi:MAG: mitochondrial fission ELM1 family protein [Pseudomonadota bacterium]
MAGAAASRPAQPLIWTATDGRAGNAAQVRSLAAALLDAPPAAEIERPHAVRGLTLPPRAPWTALPAWAWPAPFSALTQEARAALAPPWPKIWIGAGRRTAPISAEVKRRAGGETFVIHMLDPHMAPGRFDLLVTPEHDRRRGPGVLTTIGTPAYFSAEAMAEADGAFAAPPGQRAVVLLGGASKTHSFTEAAAAALEGHLKALAAAGWHFRITASRRTPDAITAQMRALAEEIGGEFWAGPSDGPNPYLAWLIQADTALVTEDSANMLCEAAYHGLPIHMVRLKGKAAKFTTLHQSLIAGGHARWFSGALEVWKAAPLREAERVAKAIWARVQAAP